MKGKLLNTQKIYKSFDKDMNNLVIIRFNNLIIIEFNSFKN